VRARERSRPHEWTDAPERCRPAGVPQDRHVATPPPRAQPRWGRAGAAGGAATWGTGARGSGDERRVRPWVATPPQADVLAVTGQEDGGQGGPPRPVHTRLAAGPEDGWTRLRAGDGAQGPRGYDGRWRPRAAPLDPGWRRWRLLRRRVSAPPERTASVVWARQAATLAAVVPVAGRRWTIARSVATATGGVGLDHDAGRSGTGWYRPRTRALGADACWVVRRAGTMALAALHTTLSPTQARSIQAGCTARRGLRPRGASLHCGDYGGGWSSPGRRPPCRSWRGPAGAVGSNAWPNTITTNVVAHDLGPSLPHHVVTTVVLDFGAKPPARLVVSSLEAGPTMGGGPMRRDRDAALNRFDVVPAVGMTRAPGLLPRDTRLDDDRRLQAVPADVVRRRPRTRLDGRPSTPVEVILRRLVVKPWSGWSDEATERGGRARLGVRQCCRVEAAAGPDEPTLLRGANLRHPATRQRRLAPVVTRARALNVTRGRTRRSDGTVVAPTSQHPPASTGRDAGVRGLGRTLTRARNLLGIGRSTFVRSTYIRTSEQERASLGTVPFVVYY